MIWLSGYNLVWFAIARGLKRFLSYRVSVIQGFSYMGLVVVIIHKFYLNSVVRSPTTPPKDSDPPIPTHVLAKLLCGRYNTQALVYEIWGLELHESSVTYRFSYTGGLVKFSSEK